jgi:hypothetical protein
VTGLLAHGVVSAWVPLVLLALFAVVLVAVLVLVRRVERSRATEAEQRRVVDRLLTAETVARRRAEQTRELAAALATVDGHAELAHVLAGFLAAASGGRATVGFVDDAAGAVELLGAQEVLEGGRLVSVEPPEPVPLAEDRPLTECLRTARLVEHGPAHGGGAHWEAPAGRVAICVPVADPARPGAVAGVLVVAWERTARVSPGS